jgi:hypothetical protein
MLADVFPSHGGSRATAHSELVNLYYDFLGKSMKKIKRLQPVHDTATCRSSADNSILFGLFLVKGTSLQEVMCAIAFSILPMCLR